MWGRSDWGPWSARPPRTSPSDNPARTPESMSSITPGHSRARAFAIRSARTRRNHTGPAAAAMAATLASAGVTVTVKTTSPATSAKPAQASVNAQVGVW